MPFNLENNNYLKNQRIYIPSDVQDDFMYSDGDKEENFLSETIYSADDLSVGSEELQRKICDWSSLYHLSPKRADLLRPFAGDLKNKKVLEIGSGCGAITRYLGELNCNVLSLEGSLRRARICAERCRDLNNVSVVNDNFNHFKCSEKFDVVVLVGVLEYSNLFMSGEDNAPLSMLVKAKEFLAPDGKLIVAIENKIGLKYWSGAPEDHVGESYFNIQNLYGNKGVVTFGQYELTSLVRQAGFELTDLMYPFPDYKFADVIVTETGFKTRGFNALDLLLEKFEYFQNKRYESRFSTNLAASSLYNNLLLSQFANSFLLMATNGNSRHLPKENQILAYVHSTLRKKYYCKQTIFTLDGRSDDILVSRQLLYAAQGGDTPYVQHLVENESYINGQILMATILPVVSVNGWNTKDIINWSRTFYEVLISKSFDSDNQAWLEGKFLDLTPFNIVLAEGQPKIFDLEWISKERIPAYYIFLRGLAHTFWRLPFVNLPELGTPLQVIELVKEVTRYYFHFDSAEFDDCKEREIKYFSPIGTQEMTQAFPLLELNIRNSDNQKLLETNKEVAFQNAKLSHELLENKQELNTRIIALLEELRKKEEQFNIERWRQEEAVRIKAKQFDDQKALLIEELRIKERLFSTQKNALLNEAKQKESDLLQEINHQKGIIKWYANTYEYRSTLGVLKTKIASFVKKKINRNNGDWTSRGIDFRHKKYHYSLLPIQGIALHNDQEYAATGTDPFFIVDLKNKVLKPGWYSLFINVVQREGVLLSPRLYFDYGSGFDEEDIWNLPKPTKGKIACLIYLRSNLKKLRFDPSTMECEFFIGAFRLTPSSRLIALRHAFSRYRKIYSSSDNYFLALTELLGLFFKSGSNEVRLRLWDAIHFKEDKTWEKYTEWCELYDSISEENIDAIKSLSNNLRYQPVFSIVMPVYNVPVKYLKKAIESVEKQAYDKWELCIADDRSTNAKVIKFLKKYQAKDKRIKIVFRESNGGISEASNSALKIATGDYMVLLDNDDELTPHALYMVAKAINEKQNLKIIFSDEDKLNDQGSRYEPYFKTDWNVDLFYGQNMINHLGIYDISLIRQIGGFRSKFDGSQDYDLALRCIEQLSPDQIHHIQHILYHWRAIKGSVALSIKNKSSAVDAGLNAINDHLRRTRQNAIAESNINSSYRVKWQLPSRKPSVSIVIPTKDKWDILSTCITSIIEKTTYKDFEILVIDNDSRDTETLEYLSKIQLDYEQVKVFTYKSEFNFSAIVNHGVSQSTADVIVLLNNDTEVINSNWLDEMVSQSMRHDIGAVGAKLFYPNGQIQHAGVVLYEGHPGNHIYLRKDKNDPGYFNKLNLVQNYSAVTAACLAVRREIYIKVGGFDEKNLKVAYNDVDFCLKVRKAGYRNLWTPFAQLIHYESLSRGNDLDEMNYARFKGEQMYMLQTWENEIVNDPFFNPNLGYDTRTNQIAFPPRVNYPWKTQTHRMAAHHGNSPFEQ
jgi:GT2 family glycosyltransferase/SAM-dependent methyltransferase